MKVKDLIEILSNLNPNLDIIDSKHNKIIGTSLILELKAVRLDTEENIED